MKSAAADQRKHLQLARFKAISPPFTFANGSIYSFAVNEVTSELLYADAKGVHLLAFRSNEELKSIPYTDLIKQEISRYSERKQQEILATYSSHGVQYLNVIQTQNIWLGVISRKRFIFFSEELAVSNESPIDMTGITGLKIHHETGDIFTLTGDGKIQMWGSEVISDIGKKRVSDFDVKIIMKKKFPAEGPILKFDVNWGTFPYVVGVGENAQGSPAVVQVWDYTTGDKLPSISHSENSSVSLVAVGVSHNYLILVDSARNIAIHDLSTQAEVHKRHVGASLALVDTILIEESELSAGVYLIDSTGKVFDYSMTNAIVLSAYAHSRAKERESGAFMSSPRTTDKNFSSALRSALLDDHAAPGSVYSRFNTCFRLITQHSGRMQLWALFDGSLNILNLASTGRVVETNGKVANMRKLQATLPQSPAVSTLMEMHFDSGAIVLMDATTEKQQKPLTGYLEILKKRNETMSKCQMTLDFSTVVSVSESGGLLCYDYTTKVHSRDFQLSKIIVTTLCLTPKYSTISEDSDEANQLSIILGTDSGVIMVFEYSPRTRLMELKKRYAGHDVVVSLHYRPWDRRVLTVGRDGYLKFLLCDRYFEWDSASFKGYWNDCTASAMCGRAMVLMGYESGMLQTLYFSPTATSPTSALLEYHTTNITSVCGLDFSLSEGVSGDASGNMVLWNLETSEPLKLLTLYTGVDVLLAFGTHKVESLYAVTTGSLVKLNLDRSRLYRKLTKKDILAYKAESKRRRLDNRKKVSRAAAQYGVKAKPAVVRQGTIEELFHKVTDTKERLLPDPVEAIKMKSNRAKAVDEEVVVQETAAKTFDDRFKDRALTAIIERNHVERFKKSLAITIKHFNQWIPRELMFNGRFKTRSLVITPTNPHLPGIPKTAYPGKTTRKVPEDSSVYMTRSLSHTFKHFPQKSGGLF